MCSLFPNNTMWTVCHECCPNSGLPFSPSIQRLFDARLKWLEIHAPNLSLLHTQGYALLNTYLLDSQFGHS